MKTTFQDERLKTSTSQVKKSKILSQNKFTHENKICVKNSVENHASFSYATVDMFLCAGLGPIQLLDLSSFNVLAPFIDC